MTKLQHSSMTRLLLFIRFILFQKKISEKKNLKNTHTSPSPFTFMIQSFNTLHSFCWGLSCERRRLLVLSNGLLLWVALDRLSLDRLLWVLLCGVALLLCRVSLLCWGDGLCVHNLLGFEAAAVCAAAEHDAHNNADDDQENDSAHDQPNDQRPPAFAAAPACVAPAAVVRAVPRFHAKQAVAVVIALIIVIPPCLCACKEDNRK